VLDVSVVRSRHRHRSISRKRSERAPSATLDEPAGA
jgi:hypothetical protein